jgi:hypothetical protein
MIGKKSSKDHLGNLEISTKLVRDLVQGATVRHAWPDRSETMLRKSNALWEIGRTRAAIRTMGIASALALGILSSPALAVVAYDEGTSGDLSNSGLAPTPVTFVPGDNIVSGTSGKNTAGVVDRDYFTFTLGPNEFLTELVVQTGTMPIGLSFIGLQAGDQVTLSPTTTTAAGLLGWTHYGASDVGTDILDNMSVPARGSSGFTPPLGPGTYSVWAQEASSGVAPYSFNFMVSMVPEPSSWVMMFIGLGIMGMVLRRDRRRTLATP